jgi:hypothetical protein
VRSFCKYTLLLKTMGAALNTLRSPSSIRTGSLTDDTNVTMPAFDDNTGSRSPTIGCDGMLTGPSLPIVDVEMMRPSRTRRTMPGSTISVSSFCATIDEAGAFFVIGMRKATFGGWVRSADTATPTNSPFFVNTFTVPPSGDVTS